MGELGQRPSDLKSLQFLLFDSLEKVCQNPLTEPAVYQQFFFCFLKKKTKNKSPVSCNEGPIMAVSLPSHGESEKMLLVLEA